MFSTAAGTMLTTALSLPAKCRKELDIVVVFAWIGQILLFFIFWKLFHWILMRTGDSVISGSIIKELGLNLVLVVLLLIVLDNIHSAWWLMVIVGSVVGVISGQITSRYVSKR
jgi:hypothetical protein